MEILNYLLDNFTMVEITIIALIIDVSLTVLVVVSGIHIARYLRLISKEKYQNSISQKKGLSKFKKGLCYFYLSAAVVLVVSTGFGAHWQQDKTIKVWQQGEVAQIKQEIDQKLNNFVQKKDIRDMCFGLIKGGQTYSTCLSQSPADDLFELNDSAIFEIGSITKTFTYKAMLEVLDKHNIEINSPIGKFLPETLTEINPAIADITWQQLATHTSGLSRMPLGWNWTSVDSIFESVTLGNGFEALSTDYVYDYLATATLDEERGKKAQYSNLGVGLLGLLLGKIEEKSYPQLVQELIVSPLNMVSTTGGIAVDSGKSVDAYGQYRRLGPVVIAAKSEPIALSDAMAGAGAANSSLSDMMIYLKNSMQEYQKPVFQDVVYSAPISDKTMINLGWIVKQLSQQDNEKIVMHDGATGGFRSYMGFDQSSQVGIVILANGTRSVNSLGNNMLKLLLEDTELSESIAAL